MDPLSASIFVKFITFLPDFNMEGLLSLLGVSLSGRLFVKLLSWKVASMNELCGDGINLVETLSPEIIP